jgi:hypothetical protein
MFDIAFACRIGISLRLCARRLRAVLPQTLALAVRRSPRTSQALRRASTRVSRSRTGLAALLGRISLRARSNLLSFCLHSPYQYFFTACLIRCLLLRHFARSASRCGAGGFAANRRLCCRRYHIVFATCHCGAAAQLSNIMLSWRSDLVCGARLRLKNGVAARARWGVRANGVQRRSGDIGMNNVRDNNGAGATAAAPTSMALVATPGVSRAARVRTAHRRLLRAPVSL